MNRFIPFFLFAALLLAGLSAEAGTCNTCHSKNPRMVRMHAALDYDDCFSCHGPSAAAIDKSKRSTDTRCMKCHKV